MIFYSLRHFQNELGKVYSCPAKENILTTCRFGTMTLFWYHTKGLLNVDELHEHSKCRV